MAAGVNVPSDAFTATRTIQSLDNGVTPAFNWNNGFPHIAKLNGSGVGTLIYGIYSSYDLNALPQMFIKISTPSYVGQDWSRED